MSASDRVEDWEAWGRRKTVLADIEAERFAQIEKWGVQGHAAFAPEALYDTPRSYWGDSFLPEAELVAEYYGVPTAARAKALCQAEHATGDSSWIAIAVEELAEAVEAAVEGDLVNLRTELVQTAAVLVAWVEDLDRTRAQAREDAIERNYNRQKGSA